MLLSFHPYYRVLDFSLSLPSVARRDIQFRKYLLHARPQESEAKMQAPSCRSTAASTETNVLVGVGA